MNDPRLFFFLPCFILLRSHHVASPLTGLPPLRIRATPSATEFFSATQRTRRGGIVSLFLRSRIEKEKLRALGLSLRLSLASSAVSVRAGGHRLERRHCAGCERTEGQRGRRTIRGRDERAKPNNERERESGRNKSSGRVQNSSSSLHSFFVPLLSQPPLFPRFLRRFFASSFHSYFIFRARGLRRFNSALREAKEERTQRLLLALHCSTRALDLRSIEVFYRFASATPLPSFRTPTRSLSLHT